MQLTQTGPESPGAVEHPAGQYRFLPGNFAYSAGVAAMPGYQIVHATLAGTPELEAGFGTIDRHLAELKLAPLALCALELRSPEPCTGEGFREFNKRYAGFLRSRQILLLNGQNPIARTNVAPLVAAPGAPAIRGFSYVIPAKSTRATFIVAGAGELPNGPFDPAGIVRRDDTSLAAMAEKARYVMAHMTARLHGLGVRWSEVTTIDVYTVQEFSRELASELLGMAGHNALTWNYARPPIEGLEFEMDVRGVQHEIVLT